MSLHKITPQPGHGTGGARMRKGADFLPNDKPRRGRDSGGRASGGAVSPTP